ncbi:hypothetical protein NST48_12555 [Paenibacillus sp. FSL M7-0547]|uniref:hypothetical protein n=1 Tax=Paenibacillus sp. FSL M7-0547 TaxID=2954755 RepID=UPI0030F4C084
MSKMGELLKAMDAATENPAETCLEEKEHDYKFLSHADGRESWTDYYRCNNCNHVIKREKQRTGMNRELWK